MGVVCGPGLPPLPFCLRPSSRHVTPRPRACAGRLAAVVVSGLRGPGAAAEEEAVVAEAGVFGAPARGARPFGGGGGRVFFG